MYYLKKKYELLIILKVYDSCNKVEIRKKGSYYRVDFGELKCSILSQKSKTHRKNACFGHLKGS